eukprot:TRINITY_DN9144_c0_g1_i1.p1 TRINITY_DN9144_c0_g1~~TRINITY_DN9144_c0_g1_i1.p1  ORF type:complete len:101 (+),score=19.14 TRINITY_DN9144_c0_g1_i1:206-508(+)
MNEDNDVRATVAGMEKVSLRLFIGGFFALPLLWAFNFWFFKDLLFFHKTPTSVKVYAWASLFLFLVSATACVVWFGYFYFDWYEFLEDVPIVFSPRGGVH